MTSSIGKLALLSWASRLSGVHCGKLEDLRTGVVLLAVLHKVFPRLGEKKLNVKWQPATTRGHSELGCD